MTLGTSLQVVSKAHTLEILAFALPSAWNSVPSDSQMAPFSYFCRSLPKQDLTQGCLQVTFSLALWCPLPLGFMTIWHGICLAHCLPSPQYLEKTPWGQSLFYSLLHSQCLEKDLVQSSHWLNICWVHQKCCAWVSSSDVPHSPTRQIQQMWHIPEKASGGAGSTLRRQTSEPVSGHLMHELIVKGRGATQHWSSRCSNLPPTRESKEPPPCLSI